MTLLIDSHLFPMPGIAYSEERRHPLEKLVPLSIFALNLEVLHAPSNLLETKGHFFFRNGAIPLPRPCTYPAWDRICRIGHIESSSFIPPFLPALGIDDEIGRESGVGLPSLSRKSKHHLRDGNGRIVWGQVYLGHVSNKSTVDNVLVGATDRSNIAESQLIPRHDYSAASGLSLLSERLSFIASHGFPSLAAACHSLSIPVVKRLMFQFLDQRKAAEWALHYVECKNLLERDPRQCDSDYKDLCESLIARCGKNVTPEEHKISQKVAALDRFSVNIDF